MHLSPVVRECAFPILGGHERIHLIDPVNVEQMHNLMSRCYMVMTDSGGLQEEAPALGKPVLVMRRETERPEAVAAGTAKLAGVEKDTIVKLASELLDSPEAYAKWRRPSTPMATAMPARASRTQFCGILACGKKSPRISAQNKHRTGRKEARFGAGA